VACVVPCVRFNRAVSPSIGLQIGLRVHVVDAVPPARFDGLANTTATLGSFYWLGFETSGLSPEKKRLAWLGAQQFLLWKQERDISRRWDERGRFSWSKDFFHSKEIMGAFGVAAKGGIYYGSPYHQRVFEILISSLLLRGCSILHDILRVDDSQPALPGIQRRATLDP